MSYKIRLADYKLSFSEWFDIHLKIMDHQCPVHFKRPQTDLVTGYIEYTCCC
jgi:hypothetical protein